MSRAAMKSAVAAVALVLTLALAAGAGAAIVTSTDLQGRSITFDVRAKTVDTNWYTDVLRATAHGDEISNVTIRSRGSADPRRLPATRTPARARRSSSRPARARTSRERWFTSTAITSMRRTRIPASPS
jgi:hypothetical protein